MDAAPADAWQVRIVVSDDRQFLEAVRRSLQEEDRFFSNAAKVERELWVAREFLTRLGVSFAVDELVPQPENCDADVVFCEARFQIKEITDATERRQAEIKAALRRAEQAHSRHELVEKPVARDIIVADLYSLIIRVASSAKYPRSVRATVDLLCYVTRPRAGFTESERGTNPELQALGWRTVCCLLGQRPYVLTLTPDSPEFLRQE